MRRRLQRWVVSIVLACLPLSHGLAQAPADARLRSIDWEGMAGPDARLTLHVRLSAPLPGALERASLQLEVDGRIWVDDVLSPAARTLRQRDGATWLSLPTRLRAARAGADPVVLLTKTHGPYRLTLRLELANGQTVEFADAGPRVRITK
jgi:hypothetical protein